jgi:guanylate kinase
MIKNSGSLFIVSAPSGAGKTSLVNSVIKQLTNIVVSISHTTRSQREAEQHGLHYYFVDDQTFQSMIQRDVFLEYAKVFDNFYGTSRLFVEQELSKGNDVILEIDWQGSQQIKEKFAHAINIFILPPSIEILRKRLVNRNQDSNAVIEARLAQAIIDIKQYKNYDYVIINDSFAQALSEIIAIIRARRVHLEVTKNIWRNVSLAMQ